MRVIAAIFCFPECPLPSSARTVGKKESDQPFQKRFLNMRIERWGIFGIQMIDPSLYEKIVTNGFGTNNIEHTFAFLAFASEQTVRDEFYSMTETFPLLRQRVSTLSEQLHNSKGIKALINAHSQRVRWHLHRIYRARNYIIHDAKIDDHMNQELVINLDRKSVV